MMSALAGAAAEAPGQARSRPVTGRCHECGEPSVKAVCAGCHRLICAEHVVSAHRVGDALRVVKRAIGIGRPADEGHRPQLCGICADGVRIDLRVLMVGAGVTMAGLVMLIWLPLVGAVAIIGGLAAVVLLIARSEVSFHAIHRRLGERLSVDASVRAVSLIDTLRASAVLDKGRPYTVTGVAAGGELLVEAEWGDAARGRVRKFLKRRPDARPAATDVWSGSVVLRGPSAWQPKSAEACSVSGRSVVLLHDRLDGHGFLWSPDGTGKRGWQAKVDYEVKPEHGKSWAAPIWVTPTIAPGSDRRALDLEIQWKKFGPGKDGLPMSGIERLVLEVPVSWGNVLRATPEALQSIVSLDDRDVCRIEWRDVTVDPETPRGRFRVSLAFDDRIQAEDSIKGEIVARFRGNLCGVKGLALYGPDGTKRRERPVRRMFTRVELGFGLSLATVRYEAVLTLPEAEHTPRAVAAADRNGEMGAAPPDGEVRTVFDRVVPDGRTVARVTAELSEGDYYVKRVVEDPAAPGRSPSIVSRYWDISGRKYAGLYPIDFHIVLSGQEHRVDGAVLSGRTEVERSVRGAYTSDTADHEVRDEWLALGKRVEAALRSCEGPTPTMDGRESVLDAIERLEREGSIGFKVADQLRKALFSASNGDERR